ncbi:hypothetical protein F4803DRAFT_544586 [Xylaria telfairii]|nr:hypothetical protein F4803DRAFT_544586 [Xylaria telfairii]
MPGVIQEPLAGCIKWLPDKKKLKSTESNIDEGCFNHPVVILSTRPQNGWVKVLIITSFGDRDLEIKFPTQRLARLDHLPIAPSKAHPDNGVLLVLRAPSDEMRKKSYVKTRDIHNVLLSSLEPYNRGSPEIFLSKRSYQILVKCTQFVEPQDTQTPYEWDDTRIAQIPLYRQDLEEHRPFVPDFYERLAEHEGTSGPTFNSYTANKYPDRYGPSLTSWKATRRPLFTCDDEDSPYSYESYYAPLPTAYSIPPDNENSSSTLWKLIKAVMCVYLISQVSPDNFWPAVAFCLPVAIWL